MAGFRRSPRGARGITTRRELWRKGKLVGAVSAAASIVVGSYFGLSLLLQSDTIGGHRMREVISVLSLLWTGDGDKFDINVIELIKAACSTSEGRKQVAESTSFRVLLDVLSKGKPEAQDIAKECLCLLLEDEQCVHKVVESLSPRDWSSLLISGRGAGIVLTHLRKGKLSANQVSLLGFQHLISEFLELRQPGHDLSPGELAHTLSTHDISPAYGNSRKHAVAALVLYTLRRRLLASDDPVYRRVARTELIHRVLTSPAMYKLACQSASVRTEFCLLIAEAACVCSAAEAQLPAQHYGLRSSETTFSSVTEWSLPPWKGAAPPPLPPPAPSLSAAAAVAHSSFSMDDSVDDAAPSPSDATVHRRRPRLRDHLFSIFQEFVGPEASQRAEVRALASLLLSSQDTLLTEARAENTAPPTCTLAELQLALLEMLKVSGARCPHRIAVSFAGDATACGGQCCSTRRR